jgi:hypothetical protein
LNKKVNKNVPTRQFGFRRDMSLALGVYAQTHTRTTSVLLVLRVYAKWAELRNVQNKVVEVPDVQGELKEQGDLCVGGSTHYILRNKIFNILFHEIYTTSAITCDQEQETGI